MKKIIYLLFILSALQGCSKDDEFVEPGQIDPVNPIEEPDDEDNEEDSDDNEETFVLKPEEVRNYMVDANATEETVALFYHLKTISKRKTIVGQQEAFNMFYQNNEGESDMKKTTGSDPGVLGSDFMFIADDDNTGDPNNWYYLQERKIVADAILAYNKGMINTFSWHLREPYEGDEFYTSAMTPFQKENAFRSILPGGANHEYYKEKLQKVGQIIQEIKGSDGTLAPVIFRPFHEFDGDWFWWGEAYNTPEEFKTAWRFTVEYLRDELNVHNILYAYSPDNSYSTSINYLMRYPGDDYVDILGMDNYGDLRPQDGSRIDAANRKLKMVSDLAIEKVKIAALTETGFFVSSENLLPPNYFENLYEVLTGNGVEVSYMLFWQNSTTAYTVPTPGQPGEEDFLEFIKKDEVILLEDMDNFYKLPD